MTAHTDQIVRRYFATVADLSSTADDLRVLLAPDATFRELPNPISPRGHVRTLEETIEGFMAGKRRLESQSIDLLEVLVADDRAAVRSVWRGRANGVDLVAHMAGFLQVRDGRIVSHDTYDCYEPFALP